ncbi:hypothetical protein [Bordetella petrii]|uniref:hypothetical protein n=1 Tax=Bordetella petrii TaxID=94624 RepID=UPI003733C63E
MSEGIPYVRPGSTAARAVSEVGQYFADHPDPTPVELEAMVKDRIVAHGGDPVTAAASAATARELAGRSPGQQRALAEQLVGVTLADPARVGQSVVQNTRQAWEKAAEGGGKVDKVGIARAQAQEALADAGAADTTSSSLFDTKFQEYLDQGVSPEMAAAQAVAMVLAQATPQAGSFSIYGYLTMLVHGNTDYVFLNEEHVKIKGSAIHTHFVSTTYNLGSNDFIVDCDTIKTSSTGEDVRTHSGHAIGRYESQYFSTATSTLSGFWWRHKWGTLTKTVSGATASISGGRVYLAGLDSDLMLWKNGGSANDIRRTPLQVRDFLKQKFSSKTHRIN